MDTDDLTPMAHEVMSLAYGACEPMRAEIGVLAGDFSSEDEFLAGVIAFLDEVLEDPESYLDSWDLLDEIKVKVFSKNVTSIRAHVQSTIATPQKLRGTPPFQKPQMA